MGRGIAGVVQLQFAMRKFDFESDKKYFAPDYFDYYTCEEEASHYMFTLKPELFLPHYGAMLLEFYDAIGEDFRQETGMEPDSELLKISDFGEFEAKFSDGNVHVPIIREGRGIVSVLACEPYSSWEFYSGSYKAYLEEYTTFMHFERILAKLMTNPLASIIKFAERG
jgi:hypothetical protein